MEWDRTVMKLVTLKVAERYPTFCSLGGSQMAAHQLKSAPESKLGSAPIDSYITNKCDKHLIDM